jgi:hypothetical protein
LLHNYYYRNRDQRKYIKNLVQLDDFSNAQTKLAQVILQDDNYIQSKNVTTEFAINDNSSLHHAQDHLDSFQITNTSEQKDATIRALDES